MSTAGKNDRAGQALLAAAREAADAVAALLADAIAKVRARVTSEGRIAAAMFDNEQRATHGLAWLATYVEAVRQIGAYAARLHSAGKLSETEELVVRIGLGEYLAQILGGIAMSQAEIVRPADLGLSAAAVAARVTPAVEALIASGNTASNRTRLVELMRADPQAGVGASGDDETLEAIRQEMRKFTESKIAPFAQAWHRANEYIPLAVIAQLADLGVFRLTIVPDYGGLGLGKEAMCVVSEELSRGYIGVGSLGTRSEIDAELILNAGT